MREFVRKWTSLAAAVATTVLVASACGGTSGGQGTAENPTDVRLVVGGQGAMVFSAVPLAEALGYFDEEGINLEVIDAGEAGRAVSTLLAGQADFSSAAFEHVIKAKEQNQELRMVALYVRYPAMSLVVGQDYSDEINEVEDLRGRPVGTSSVGSAAHYNLLALLKKNGMSQSDVDLVFAGLSEMPAALQNGQVQAAMTVDPFTTQVVEAGDVTMLYDLGTTQGSMDLYGSEYAMSGLSTRQEFIDENPETTQKMVTAVVRALRYIKTHTGEEVAAVMPSDIAPDREIYAQAVDHMKEAFTEDGRMPPEAAATTAAVLVENEIVSESATRELDTLYDMSFVENAEKELDEE